MRANGPRYLGGGVHRFECRDGEVRKFYVDAPNKAFISQRFWMICAAVEWKGWRAAVGGKLII